MRLHPELPQYCNVDENRHTYLLLLIVSFIPTGFFFLLEGGVSSSRQAVVLRYFSWDTYENDTVCFLIICFGFFSCWYSTRSPLLLNELKQCWIFSIDVNYQVKNFIIFQKFQLWSLTKYKEQFNIPCHCILSVFVHFVSVSFFSSLPWQIFRRWEKELKNWLTKIYFVLIIKTMYL